MDDGKRKENDLRQSVALSNILQFVEKYLRVEITCCGFDRPSVVRIVTWASNSLVADTGEFEVNRGGDIDIVYRVSHAEVGATLVACHELKSSFRLENNGGDVGSVVKTYK